MVLNLLNPQPSKPPTVASIRYPVRTTLASLPQQGIAPTKKLNDPIAELLALEIGDHHIIGHFGHFNCRFDRLLHERIMVGSFRGLDRNEIRCIDSLGSMKNCRFALFKMYINFLRH